ncbi:TPA: type IV secretion system protein [Pseudomonas aeruginosa]
MADLTLQGLIGATDEVTRAYVGEVFPNLAGMIEPIVYYLAIGYWVALGLQMYQGHVGVKGWDIVKRAMLTTLVFTTLNWGTGGSMLYDVWGAWTEGIAAKIISGGGDTATMLDALYEDIGKVASLMMNVNWRQIAMIVMGTGLFILNCILFIAAILNMLIAKFGAAIIMAMLPVLIGFIFFDGTKQWAMNWFSKMLNFSLIYILSIAVVRFGYQIFGEAIEEVSQTATYSDAAMITAQQWGTLVIVEGVMIICMLQVRGWAAALSSGAAVGGSSLVLMAMRTLGMRR